MEARTIFYTPKVHNTPRLIDKDVRTLQDRLGWLIEFETAGSNYGAQKGWRAAVLRGRLPAV